MPQFFSIIIKVWFLELKFEFVRTRFNWHGPGCKHTCAVRPVAMQHAPKQLFPSVLLNKLLDLFFLTFSSLKADTIQKSLIERGCSVVLERVHNLLSEWLPCVSSLAHSWERNHKPLPPSCRFFFTHNPSVSRSSPVLVTPASPPHCHHHQHCPRLTSSSLQPPFRTPPIPVLFTLTCLLHWLVTFDIYVCNLALSLPFV